MAKKFTWKLWLLPNLLTKDAANDYIADVSTAGTTLRNEDIARQIVNERSELRYETILSALNERDAVVRNAVLGGFSVLDGNVHLAPRVKGAWEGTAHLFDPKQHKITVDATPSAEFRKALEEEVGVEVLGEKIGGGAFIGLVTDVATGKTDGTISPYGTLNIDGEKIKIAPVDENGAPEEGLGVFFVAADGAKTASIFGLSLNDPKKIICTVPPLAPGSYKLQIATRYTSGNKLLKEPRSISYELPVTVAGNVAKQE